MAKKEFLLVGNFLGKNKKQSCITAKARKKEMQMQMWGQAPHNHKHQPHLHLTHSHFFVLCRYCEWYMHSSACIAKVANNQNKGFLNNGVEFVWCCVIIRILWALIGESWHSWKRARLKSHKTEKIFPQCDRWGFWNCKKKKLCLKWNIEKDCDMTLRDQSQVKPN